MLFSRGLGEVEQEGMKFEDESISPSESKQLYRKTEMKEVLTLPTNVRSSVKFPS